MLLDLGVALLDVKEHSHPIQQGIGIQVDDKGVSRRDDSGHVDAHHLVDRGPVVVGRRAGIVEWLEQVIRSARLHLYPLGPGGVPLQEPAVLLLPFAPEIDVADKSGRCRRLPEEPDGYTLLDVEHVDIPIAVRRNLLLLEVSVKIEHADSLKGLQERPSHSAKRGVVEVTVIADVPVYADTGEVEQPLREADELHVVVLEPHLALAERLTVDVVVARGPRSIREPPLEKTADPRAHVRREAGVGWIPHHHCEPPLPLDLVDRLGLMRQRRQEAERELAFARRLECVRQVHPRPLVALEAVAGLVELEADLEVRDSVRRHQELVAVQAWQEVSRDVLVPERLDLGLGVALGIPLLDHRLVDEVDDLNEKSAGARGGVEDLNERIGGQRVSGDLQILLALGHLAPSGRIGKAVGEAELRAEERVDRAHDVGDHGARRVEDATLDLLLPVVGGEEMLIEVDDRVFLGVPVAEVADDPLHPGLVEQLHDLGDAELVEVDARSAGPAAATAYAQEGLQQLPEEWVGPHVGGEVVGRAASGVGDAGGEQPVRNGLGIHVGEASLVQIVDERGLERLHELRERAGLGLDGDGGLGPVPDRTGERRQTLGELLRGGDDLAVAQREGGAPALAPRNGVVLVVGPCEMVGQLAGDGIEMERRVEIVPAEHLERRQVVAIGRFREVGEGDAALLAFTVVGHEEQVVGGPSLPLRLVVRGALLERYLAEDAAQRHHGQALGLELDEEDAPRLTRRERAQALDLLDLGRVLGVDPELLLWVVLEGQLLEVVRVDRPAELVAQVRDELIEAADASEAFAVVGRHRFSSRSAPSSSAAAA